MPSVASDASTHGSAPLAYNLSFAMLFGAHAQITGNHQGIALATDQGARVASSPQQVGRRTCHICQPCLSSATSSLTAGTSWLSNWGTRCRPHCKCTPLPSWQQGIQPMRPQLEPLPRRRGVDRRACRASDEGDASRRHPNRESLPNIFVGCTLPDGAYGTTGCRWQNGPLEKAAAAMDWGIVARGPTNQFDRQHCSHETTNRWANRSSESYRASFVMGPHGRVSSSDAAAALLTLRRQGKGGWPHGQHGAPGI